MRDFMSTTPREEGGRKRKKMRNRGKRKNTKEHKADYEDDIAFSKRRG